MAGNDFQKSSRMVEEGRGCISHGLLAGGESDYLSWQFWDSWQLLLPPMSVCSHLALCSPVSVSGLSSVPPPAEVCTGVAGTCVQIQRPLVTELVLVGPRVG